MLLFFLSRDEHPLLWQELMEVTAMERRKKKTETPLILDVLILRNKGLSTTEIAKILNTTEAKVVSVLNRR